MVAMGRILLLKFYGYFVGQVRRFNINYMLNLRILA